MDWRDQSLLQSRSLLDWTGWTISWCCYIFFTLFILFMSWLDCGFAMHLIPRLGLDYCCCLWLFKLVIGCHWYLLHESKFHWCEVWDLSPKFTTDIYYVSICFLQILPQTIVLVHWLIVCGLNLKWSFSFFLHHQHSSSSKTCNWCRIHQVLKHLSLSKSINQVCAF